MSLVYPHSRSGVPGQQWRARRGAYWSTRHRRWDGCANGDGAGDGNSDDEMRAATVLVDVGGCFRSLLDSFLH